MRQFRILVAAILGAGLLACGSSPRTAAPHTTPTTVVAASVASSATEATPSASAAVPAQFGVRRFPVTAAEVPKSWHAGCPVAPGGLTRLQLSYWGFDDRPHVGDLVVATAAAADLGTVFRSLYDQRFPIRRMRPVEVYGGSDDASMADDNTSGFNCRNAVGTGAAHWSQHAYGLAIDVNTVENPYLLGGRVLPPAGAAFTDRRDVRPGMAVAGGVLVAAFAAVGWQWGGRSSSAPDYQHFSRSGT
jgi:hypothetical protein